MIMENYNGRVRYEHDPVIYYYMSCHNKTILRMSTIITSTKMIGNKKRGRGSNGNYMQIWTRGKDGKWTNPNSEMELSDEQIEHDFRMGFLLPYYGD